jgi:phage terminase small subunit
MKTNPNNANQYVMDPRQKKCWELYINSNSKTFANAYQSAVEAGYEASYAEVITTRPWFEEKVRKLNLVNKAEKNLNDLLGSEDERVKADMTKFTLSRLKKEDYSERSEVTGKDGKDLQPLLVKFIDENDSNTK